MGLFGSIFGKRSSVHCARCNNTVSERDIKGHNGKVYCSSCYNLILREEKQAKEPDRSRRESGVRSGTKTIQIDTTHDYTKAPMSVQQIRAAFQEANIKFRVNHYGDQWEVVAPVSGQNNQFDIKLICPESGGSVAVRVFSLAHIEDNKLAQALALLNEFQNTYRFLRFTLDSDNDLKLEYDITASTPNMGDVAVELVVRTMGIVDHMYAELMKCIWA